MAVNSLNVIQSNIDRGCNLMAVHSPLNFVVEVYHDGNVPQNCTVEINGANGYVATFRMLPIEDITPLNIRRFMFIGENILKSQMQEVDDVIIGDKVLQAQPQMTMEFELKFSCEGVEWVLPINAYAGSTQIGKPSAMLDIFHNETFFYCGGANKPIYIYFYLEEDEVNEYTVGVPSDSNVTQDFDKVTFTDFDDYYFRY